VGAEGAEVRQQQVALVAPALERGRVEADDLRADTVRKLLLARYQRGAGRRHARDALYSEATHNYVLDLVDVVQHGDARNTFYWQAGQGQGVGMLGSLAMLLTSNYGTMAALHVSKLREIARSGSPQVWAFVWLIFLSIDGGLQAYVCSDQVRDYVGTDGRRKEPVDAAALHNYLTHLRHAMREYAISGMADGAPVRNAMLMWHVFGGRRVPR
jgi:hypothetical protein